MALRACCAETKTTSWDARSFKVNGKVILFWNPTHDCPVFKVPVEERDFLIEADPDTFFTTDHHRPLAAGAGAAGPARSRLGAGQHRAGLAGAGEEADAEGVRRGAGAAMTDALALADRTGLPDPLRVLRRRLSADRRGRRTRTSPR